VKRIGGNFLFGILILLFGLALLFNNLGIADIDIGDIISTWWPLFVIVAGLSLLLNHGSKGEVLSGIFILFVGVALLLGNLDIWNINLSFVFKLFWPTILILVGVSFLTGRRGSGKSNYAIMGGIERNKEPWTLDETGFVAFMGGIELNFKYAEIPDGETVIDLTAVMGGIEIKVPKDIDVECKGSVILGGLEMLSRSTGGIVASTSSSQKGSGESNKKLRFYCRAIMGGIEIKAID
jgi:predicted membrane protein